MTAPADHGHFDPAIAYGGLSLAIRVFAIQTKDGMAKIRAQVSKLPESGEGSKLAGKRPNSPLNYA
jgi:hypothetical protein